MLETAPLVAAKMRKYPGFKSCISCPWGLKHYASCLSFFLKKNEVGNIVSMHFLLVLQNQTVRVPAGQWGSVFSGWLGDSESLYFLHTATRRCIWYLQKSVFHAKSLIHISTGPINYINITMYYTMFKLLFAPLTINQKLNLSSDHREFKIAVILAVILRFLSYPFDPYSLLNPLLVLILFNRVRHYLSYQNRLRIWARLSLRSTCFSLRTRIGNNSGSLTVLGDNWCHSNHCLRSGFVFS
jgi:hypothetical protein